jgi:hypothetical protein
VVGLWVKKGSIKIILPFGLTILKVEWPSHISLIFVFIIRMIYYYLFDEVATLMI